MGERRAERVARAGLIAAGIDDELDAAAVFTANAGRLDGWVLADLATPAQRPARLLVGVGARAIYGLSLPRSHRSATGLAFVLDPDTTWVEPTTRSRELVVHDERSAQVIRLSGAGLHPTRTRATIAAIRALATARRPS